jgi:predicted amidohydrolase
MSRYTVAAVNMQVVSDRKQENLRKLLRFIEEAAERKVDMLLFPELALEGYL